MMEIEEMGKAGSGTDGMKRNSAEKSWRYAGDGNRGNGQSRQWN